MTISFVNDQLSKLEDSIPAARCEVAYQAGQLAAAKTDKQIATATNAYVAARAQLKTLERSRESALRQKKQMLRVATVS